MSDRRVLLLAHTGRPEAVHAATDVVRLLTADGVRTVMVPEEAVALEPAEQAMLDVCDIDSAVAEAELVIVLGGDGTILRAAELVRDTSVPLVGVNLGHVGFLAESEREELEEAVERIVARDYRVEERMTLDVRVLRGNDEVARSWAVNEVSVEKANRERMVELVVDVDGRPLSRFGCDGVVAATPTGSTAYAFSAGGPIVWPEVEAMLVVPLSAHALFARPLVIAPSSTVGLEVLPGMGDGGVLWCDGRRTFDAPVGSRIEVRRSARPVRLARLTEGAFTDRLVAKFRLPVQGWRGPGPQQ